VGSEMCIRDSANTKVNKRKILKLAKKQGTIEIAREIFGETKRPVKLSDTVGSKTISKDDWERAREVIRNAEPETRKKLRKTLS